MKNIHKFASYNGFPKRIVDSTMKKANKQKQLSAFVLTLPCIRNASEQIVKRSKKNEEDAAKKSVVRRSLNVHGKRFLTIFKANLASEFSVLNLWEP